MVLRNKILIKDNLRKRNGQGPVDCVFYGIAESIDHLFFKCLMARYVWRLIQVSLNITCIPSNIDDLFGVWMRNFKKKNTNMILSSVVGLSCGQFRGLGMIGVLEIKLFMIRLMWYSYAAFGWIPGPSNRKRRKKGWWNKEASLREGRQVMCCAVPSARDRWIVEFLGVSPLSPADSSSLSVVWSSVDCPFLVLFV